VRAAQSRHQKFFGPGKKPESKQQETGNRFKPGKGDAEPATPAKGPEDADKIDVFDFLLAYLCEINGDGMLSVDRADFDGFCESLADKETFGLYARVPEESGGARLEFGISDQ
jgi:hypothetical protein